MGGEQRRVVKAHVVCSIHSPGQSSPNLPDFATAKLDNVKKGLVGIGGGLAKDMLGCLTRIWICVREGAKQQRRRIGHGAAVRRADVVVASREKSTRLPACFGARDVPSANR